MPAIIPDNGLDRRLVQAYQATAGAGPTYNVARFIRTGAIDDSSVSFTSTDTALDDGGAVANEFDVAFDATPTRSGRVVTMIYTIPAGSGNFTIRRTSQHDDTAANVTASSDTLVGGIDGQSLAKTSDFSLEFTVTDTAADAS